MPIAPSALTSRGTPRIETQYIWPARPAPLLLIPIVFLIHGYHPFAGDAGIYTAGIRHILNPSLYPLNAAFVTAFTHLSLFAWTVAALVRVTHLPLAWVLLLAQLVSVALFLAAAGRLAARLFAAESARWCAVLLAAAAFTLPVAGTALFLMDPYVTARSFSTPLSLFAIAACLDRKPLRTTVLIVVTTLIHPLMAAYVAAFVILLALVLAGRMRGAINLCCTAFLVAAIAFLWSRTLPISGAYYEAVSLPQRTFLFLARWHWYEVLGLLLPLLLLSFALSRLPHTSPIRALCFASTLLGLTSLFIAACFVPPNGPYLLVPLQVLRSFHIIYAVGLVLLAGLLSGLARRSRIAVVAIIVMICAVMFAAQRAQWPGIAHIEWSGAETANPYQQAFLWIRTHTPRNAVFAFDPQLVYRTGEDEQGFRAIAERDHLADDKDAGIVAVQPGFADRWAAQRNATANLDRQSDAQRRAALAQFGAVWLLLPPTAQTSLRCPYRNSAVKVCTLTQ